MTLENLVNRYDRQQLITGWNQEKLEGARIAIVGTEILSNYVALAAACLGFGSIRVFGTGKVTSNHLANHDRNNLVPDYSQGFLYFESVANEPRAESIANFLKKVNPLVNVDALPIDLSYSENMRLLGQPDIIFETTNDPYSKNSVIDYASQKRIPVLSMSSHELKAGLGLFEPSSRRRDKEKLIENILFAEFYSKKQGITTSQLISAMAVDEARKCIMPIGEEKPITDMIVYNLCSDKRFDHSLDKQVEGNDNFKGKSVLMVGAGALGNFVGLDSILNNVGTLYIMDFDTVEPTNLNRQVWFYDAVGQNKAKALASRLKEINPRVKYVVLTQKLVPESEALFQKKDFDLVVDTVDNNKARALVNYFTLKYNIPFISGGTTYNSGQAVVSIPGETACLNCQASIDRLALNSDQTHRSCIYAPQPSVITSNQIIASLMGGEAKSVLQREKYGGPTHFVLKYVSNELYRLASLPSQEPCSCSEDKKMLESWPKKMEALYQD